MLTWSMHRSLWHTEFQALTIRWACSNFNSHCRIILQIFFKDSMVDDIKHSLCRVILNGRQNGDCHAVLKYSDNTLNARQKFFENILKQQKESDLSRANQSRQNCSITFSCMLIYVRGILHSQKGIITIQCQLLSGVHF